MNKELAAVLNALTPAGQLRLLADIIDNRSDGNAEIGYLLTVHVRDQLTSVIARVHQEIGVATPLAGTP